MTDFFKFLSNGRYGDQQIKRLNHRYDHIVAPLAAEIPGARVLDLGSHDGRWPYAFAAAGAESVLGIEGRAEVAAEYGSFPDSPFKSKVTLRVGDFVNVMDELIAEKRSFDIVSCLGVYYHTMQHYRMMIQMASLNPKAIVIDSIMSLGKGLSISVVRNRTEAKLNAIAETAGQPWVPVGLPTLGALRLMAASVGYEVSEVPWLASKDELRGGGVADYFDKFENKRRMTLVLRPAGKGELELPPHVRNAGKKRQGRLRKPGRRGASARS